jgi:excisionase family DNA binding protein
MNPSDIRQEFVRVHRAARALGVTRHTIYNMIKDDRLDAVRFGPRDIRVRLSSMERLTGVNLRD